MFYSVHIISLHGENVNSALHFNKSIIISLLKLNYERLRKQMINTFWILKKYFKTYHIKIAFLEGNFVGFIGSPLGLFSKTKVVFCDHGAFLNQFKDKDIKLMRKVSSIFCNQIVVLTKKSKEDYERYFQVKDSKITNIYNWINEDIINEKRIYNSESKIILTAGRFTKEKGFDLLLQVAKIVLPINPEWQWYIYGEGPLKRTILNEIYICGLENSLIIKEFTDNMEQVYQQAALYVLPSYREGLPLVLLEAKAYKIPCISFNIITGPNEIIEDGKNGCLIEPYNVEAMANCINNLIQNLEFRKILSSNAYSNINKFRENHILNQWVNLINQLLDTR